MSFLSLKNVNVIYQNNNHILKDLNLDVQKGELVSLLGPSGCGKTTTLRVVAGLLEATSGDFILDEHTMTKVPVHKRQFGMVFQSYALFPHLTVFENVAFGLRLKKLDAQLISQKVNEALEICGLAQLGDRYPKALSGGQRQRVALARALVIEPKLLLLDEPLSNLDAKLRLQMRLEIKRIQQRLNITTLFVTHDQEECFSISDKVAVMNNGVIEQYDTPEVIYNYPKTEFVARFIGFENFFQGTVLSPTQLQLENGHLLTGDFSTEHHKVCLTIRPDNIVISETAQQADVTGVVRVRTFLGKTYQYEVETEIGTLLVNGGQLFNVGDNVALAFPLEKLIILKK